MLKAKTDQMDFLSNQNPRQRIYDHRPGERITGWTPYCNNFERIKQMQRELRARSIVLKRPAAK